MESKVNPDDKLKNGARPLNTEEKDVQVEKNLIEAVSSKLDDKQVW